MYEFEDGTKIYISIHTPAQGVTHIKIMSMHVCNDFNPHSRTGSDLQQRRRYRWLMNFNPHSRTGSDAQKAETQAMGLNISIHTPAQGVTVVGWDLTIPQ